MPNRLGINTYHVKTIVGMNDTIYYIICEEYIDTTGKTHETNMYAVDSQTADLYTARKIGEGKYTLRALEE